MLKDKQVIYQPIFLPTATWEKSLIAWDVAFNWTFCVGPRTDSLGSPRLRAASLPFTEIIKLLYVGPLDSFPCYMTNDMTIFG